MSKKATVPAKVEVTSKRFVIAKSRIGKNQIISFTNKLGVTVKYDHDEVYLANKEKLDNMPCFNKYGNYTNTYTLPSFAKEFALK